MRGLAANSVWFTIDIGSLNYLLTGTKLVGRVALRNCSSADGITISRDRASDGPASQEAAESVHAGSSEPNLANLVMPSHGELFVEHIPNLIQTEGATNPAAFSGPRLKFRCDSADPFAGRKPRKR